MIIFTLLLAGCTESTISSDKEYYDPIVKRIITGMKHNEVISIIKKYDKNIEFYNLCIKKFEKIPTECKEGYTAIGNIQLPSNNFRLGKGQAQIYLTFNAQKELIETHNEVYYEKLHK